MSQYELDLQYAKDILRIRNALHDGVIDGVNIKLIENDELQYQVTIENELKFIASIGHFDPTDTEKNRFSRTESYLSKKWIFDYRTPVYETLPMSSDFPSHPNHTYKSRGMGVALQIQPEYDEGAYFQDSLIHDSSVLSNIVLINYLYDNPLPNPYNKFMFNQSYFELVLNLLDGK